ncbi:MAG: FMN-binding protein [Promicromonosporaceae bacterium]|nr:FMN-binding protein [Promicromonosporaceae bacterium]
MRRVALWLLGTLVLVSALFWYPTSRNQPVGLAAQPGLEPAPGGAVATTTPTPPAATPAPTPDATPTPADTTPGASPAETTPTPAETTPAAGPSGTYTGQLVNMRYGNVQVEITVVDGEITNVTTVAGPTGGGRTAQINSRALPQLEANAVAAQQGQLQFVSGATFTSTAFASSLQDAINQAFG